jgi:hypothetical protein
MNVTLFGKKIFVNIIKLRWDYTQLGWALIKYDWCPYKKKRRDTQAMGKQR